jgi:hypothetical protein
VVFPVGKCIAKKALDRNEMEFVKLSGKEVLIQTISSRLSVFEYHPRRPMLQSAKNLRERIFSSWHYIV